ncbi:MAG: hypothetical protein ACOCZP_04160 [Candidatus Hadarchaeota archaeon]
MWNRLPNFLFLPPPKIGLVAAPEVAGPIATYAVYVGWRIPKVNNGTGVVVSFNVTPVVPLPVPDVYSQ